MKIENGNYYDVNDEIINEGDYVKMPNMSGAHKVYRTEDNELGIDSTNPKWIEIGRACECEFGIYPFTIYDMPEKVVLTSA